MLLGSRTLFSLSFSPNRRMATHFGSKITQIFRRILDTKWAAMAPFGLKLRENKVQDTSNIFY